LNPGSPVSFKFLLKSKSLSEAGSTIQAMLLAQMFYQRKRGDY
jgi:hypothetical protein